MSGNRIYAPVVCCQPWICNHYTLQSVLCFPRSASIGSKSPQKRDDDERRWFIFWTLEYLDGRMDRTAREEARRRDGWTFSRAQLQWGVLELRCSPQRLYKMGMQWSLLGYARRVNNRIQGLGASFAFFAFFVHDACSRQRHLRKSTSVRTWLRGGPFGMGNILIWVLIFISIFSAV